MSNTLPHLSRTVVLAISLGFAYSAAAFVGLQWAAVNGAGSPVWPAAGVAIAGLLLGGEGLWPAVVLGRLLAGFVVGSEQPLWAEVAIALGNGFAALISVHVVRRLEVLDLRLTRVTDIVWLALAGVIEAAVSGTVGTVVLAASSASVTSSVELWSKWFSGGVVGTLTVAPVILAWYGRERQERLRDWVHLTLILALAAIASAFVLLDANTPHVRAWHLFPILIWAAVAFQVRGAALALLIVSGFSIWSATIGVGPFTDFYSSAGDPVSLAQQFVAVSALVILLLGAGADERRANETLSLALQAGQLGLWDVNVPTSKARYSGRWAAMLGYDDGELEPHVSSWERLIHPDDKQRVDEAMQDHIAGRSSFYQCEHRLRHKDGSWRWILARGQIIVKDSAGRPLRAIGTHADTTAQRDAEYASQHWLRLVEGVMSAAPASIYIHNRETGQNELVNRRASKLLGYSEDAWEKLAGRILDLMHPDDRVRMPAHFERLDDCGPDQAREFEYRMRHADGSWRWFLSRDLPYERSSSGRVLRVLGTAVDITERKLAEKALEVSESRLRLALEGASAGVWELGLDNPHHYWSGEYRALFGFAADDTPSETIWQSRVHPDDLPQVLDGFTQLLDGRSLKLTQTFRILHPKHGERWIEDLIHVRNDAEGHPTSIIGITFDITARKCTQDELHQAKALLDLVFEAAPVGLAVCDRELRFVKVNKRLADFNGHSPEAHIGKRPDELLANVDQLETVLARMRETLTTGTPWLNVEITGESPVAPGVRRSFSDNFFPLRIGSEIVGIGCLVEETTQRKQAEERLRASEERFRGIYEHSPIGISITDLEGRFVACNASFARILGYAQSEIVQVHIADLIHPEDRDRNLAEVRSLLDQKVPYFEIVNRYRRKSGDPIWVRKVVSILRDAAGMPANLVALVLDMTESKLAEEHINFLLREVNHRAKNLLAVVQAVARQTARDTRPEAFADELGSRLQGLAASQDLIIKGDWQHVGLAQLVTAQLEPIVPHLDQIIDIEGPGLTIAPAAAQSIGMALHELATNALKYGALSSASGRVSVRWGLEGDEFWMYWREQDGPHVAEPERRGFGHAVTTSMVKHALQADVDLTYAPEGLSWRIVCSARSIRPEAPTLSLPHPEVAPSSRSSDDQL